MPRIISTETREKIALPELVDALETGVFDPQDEDNYASWGEMLKKLANNRDFLAELIISELRQRCAGQLRENQYSAQVILLHSSKDYIIRANFWPAMEDNFVRHSGFDPFFYNIPHDHNFSFLTVGYFGPGYWSDYYEYDYDDVIGYPGEPVNLRFVEKARLEEGKVMLYRAHRDVHLQLPADEMSISLNILETSPGSAFRDQYRFDVDNRRIDGIMTRMSLEPMLALAAHIGGEEGHELLSAVSASHPSDRIRWCALQARTGAESNVDAKLELLARGARDGSQLVGNMARRELSRLKATRDWIEQGLQRAS